MSDPATPPNPPALEFLWQRINYERMSLIPYRSNGFKLERMRELLRRLGDPHHGLPVVHIAGTKGKGSTAGMIAAILHRAGYRVGLYTSPHLERLEERYRFQDREIERDSLVSLLEELRPHVEAMDSERLDDTLRGPTFFEITTASQCLKWGSADVSIPPTFASPLCARSRALASIIRVSSGTRSPRLPGRRRASSSPACR
jgi:dihydrofolate synthase/folylpolyglutamate synthase